MEKTIEGYLLVNYRNNKMRLTKRLNKTRTGAFEIPIYLNLKIQIPEYQAPEVKLNIELPDIKVAELAADLLLNENKGDEN